MLKSYQQIIGSLIAMLLILSVACGMSGSRAQAATTSSHPLKDLQIFGQTEYGQWAGAGSLLSIETAPGGSQLPVDTAVTDNGLPSMRFNITSNGSGWGW